MSDAPLGLSLQGIDYAQLTEHWRNDIPADAVLLFLTPFGDSFYRDAQGTVWNLDLALAQVNIAADSEAEFLELLADASQAEQWLMPALQAELVSAGQVLSAGQCYGFREPPFIGGSFASDNLEPIDLQQYYDLVASLRDAQ